MMHTGYGVTIESLTPETAELVRQWRNSPAIREQMEYREWISAEMQQKWLLSIQNGPSAYFLIREAGHPVGMIHLADIDRENRRAEAGLFIGDPCFFGTGIALGASLLLLDYAFGELGIRQVFAKVKAGNETAEKYNAVLGFEKFEEYDTGFNRWVLDAEKFARTKPRLIRLVP